MTTMYDSTDVDAIPADATIVAGYIDGDYQTWTALLERFPDAAHVSITTKGSTAAMVADCETGDLTPGAAAAWAASVNAQGRRPCIYVSRDNQAAAEMALRGVGMTNDQVDWWIADWTGEAHLVPGSVATQYANPPASGGDYDVSQTDGTWPGAPAPAPDPDPAPAPDPGGPTVSVTLPQLATGSTGGAVKSLQTLLNLHSGGLAVDGTFGPATDTATRNFQTVMGLAVDGTVGPATWAALITLG